MTSCTRTITSTWASRPTTCSRRDAAGAGAWSIARFGTRAGALAAAFETRRRALRDVLKVGRTHLQDAVPITLGQEFGGYAACLRAADGGGGRRAATALYELNLGATAVGTGLNAGDDYTQLAVDGPGAIDEAAAACRPPIAFASRRAWVTSSRTRARCGASLSSSARLRATCGCCRWGRAPASPRFRCRPCSPVRRSCRAR